MIRLGNMQRFWLTAIAVALAVVLSAAAVDTVAAEDSQSPAQTPAAPVAAQPASASPPGNNSFPAQPPPAFKLGFLHELGLWWNQGFGDFSSKMKSAKDRLDDLNQDQSTKDAAAATQEALKNAAQAVVHLPGTRVFELHELCHTAANGAPDCPAAANNACRVLMSGRTPEAGECRDETYILGVVCQ
jgi:hypothetical protein